MPYPSSTPSLPQRFQLMLSCFLQKTGLAFADVLSAERIEQAFEEEGVDCVGPEDAVYTPAVTLWAFLSQVLFKGEQRSCRAGVARVVVLMLALGRKVSDDTGAYCRARARLPEAVIARLTREVAAGCEGALPEEWLWCGRHAYLVDGTTLSMPDTPENQAAWPQHRAQRPGLGYPIIRLVVLLSLATAQVADMALGPYQGKETGETALLRQMLSPRRGDVLVGDRYFCSYFMVALGIAAGVDFVTRLHAKRPGDFRQGRRLGPGDRVVRWVRPARPEWMDPATYDAIPESLEVRYVHVRVEQPGFRAQSLVVVTTLTDGARYSRQALAELYHQRWMVEISHPHCAGSNRPSHVCPAGYNRGLGVAEVGTVVPRPPSGMPRRPPMSTQWNGSAPPRPQRSRHVRSR